MITEFKNLFYALDTLGDFDTEVCYSKFSEEDWQDTIYRPEQAGLSDTASPSDLVNALDRKYEEAFAENPDQFKDYLLTCSAETLLLIERLSWRRNLVYEFKSNKMLAKAWESCTDTLHFRSLPKLLISQCNSRDGLNSPFLHLLIGEHRLPYVYVPQPLLNEIDRFQETLAYRKSRAALRLVHMAASLCAQLRGVFAFKDIMRMLKEGFGQSLSQVKVQALLETVQSSPYITPNYTKCKDESYYKHVSVTEDEEFLIQQYEYNRDEKVILPPTEALLSYFVYGFNLNDDLQTDFLATYLSLETPTAKRIKDFRQLIAKLQATLDVEQVHRVFIEDLHFEDDPDAFLAMYSAISEFYLTIPAWTAGGMNYFSAKAVRDGKDTAHRKVFLFASDMVQEGYLHKLDPVELGINKELWESFLQEQFFSTMNYIDFLQSESYRMSDIFAASTNLIVPVLNASYHLEFSPDAIRNGEADYTELAKKILSQFQTQLQVLDYKELSLYAKLFDSKQDLAPLFPEPLWDELQLMHNLESVAYSENFILCQLITLLSQGGVRLANLGSEIYLFLPEEIRDAWQKLCTASQEQETRRENYLLHCSVEAASRLYGIFDENTVMQLYNSLSSRKKTKNNVHRDMETLYVNSQCLTSFFRYDSLWMHNEIITETMSEEMEEGLRQMPPRLQMSDELPNQEIIRHIQRVRKQKNTRKALIPERKELIRVMCYRYDPQNEYASRMRQYCLNTYEEVCGRDEAESLFFTFYIKACYDDPIHLKRAIEQFTTDVIETEYTDQAEATFFNFSLAIPRWDLYGRSFRSLIPKNSPLIKMSAKFFDPQLFEESPESKVVHLSEDYFQKPYSDDSFPV